MADGEFSFQQAGGVVTTVASAFTSISATYERGKLRRMNAKHNSAMAGISAGLAKFKAAQLEKRLGEREKRELASSRAASVGEGFALDSGTNLAIDGDIIRSRSLDRQVIRANGGLEEARLKMEAIEQRGLGEIAEIEARAETVQTLLGTTSNLIGRFR